MLLLMLGAIGSPASAATFDICVLVDVLTTDSGQTANGITEDKWVGANDTDEYLVKGRGFRVKVRPGQLGRDLRQQSRDWLLQGHPQQQPRIRDPRIRLRHRQCRQPRPDPRRPDGYERILSGQHLLEALDIRRCRPPNRTTTSSTAAPRTAGPRSPLRPTPCIDTTTAMPTRRSPSVSPKVTAVVPGRSTATPRTTSRVTRPI